MSEQTLAANAAETTVPATTPFYKNKRFLITAAAVTTVAVVLSVLKFQSNLEESEQEAEAAKTEIRSMTDATSKK